MELLTSQTPWGASSFYEQRIMTTGGQKLNEENHHSEHSCEQMLGILTFECSYRN